MEFWKDPAVREVARQVLIALLLALLSVLGYDAGGGQAAHQTSHGA